MIKDNINEIIQPIGKWQIKKPKTRFLDKTYETILIQGDEKHTILPEKSKKKKELMANPKKLCT